MFKVYLNNSYDSLLIHDDKNFCFRVLMFINAYAIKLDGTIPLHNKNEQYSISKNVSGEIIISDDYVLLTEDLESFQDFIAISTI